jgi:hypothetical protein
LPPRADGSGARVHPIVGWTSRPISAAGWHSLSLKNANGFISPADVQKLEDAVAVIPTTQVITSYRRKC